jgi:general stress protein 26
MSQNETDKLFTLLSEFSTAMLITAAGDGRLRARPMEIALIEPSCRLWFITAVDTVKVHEIERETRVHIACQKDRSCYLSINGRATLVEDREKVAELWQEPHRVWFPDGPNDPSIVLISVQPEDAEYWDHTGLKKAAYLWDATRAYFTGHTPRERKEQHGMVKL